MHFKNLTSFAILCATYAFSTAQAQQNSQKQQNLPVNWHNLSSYNSGLYGVETDRAYQLLDSLNKKATKKLL